jgi:hypothetical protein
MRIAEEAPRWGALLTAWAVLAAAIAFTWSPVILALCLIWGAR